MELTFRWRDLIANRMVIQIKMEWSEVSTAEVGLLFG